MKRVSSAPPGRMRSRNHRLQYAAAVSYVLLSAALSACGASVAGANSAGIWFDQPFIGGWDDAEVAAAHCAQYGKTAVERGELLTKSEYTTPIKAYDCQ
ncbi:MAG: hypothetical protein U1E66_12600 [Rhodospirillales bacterium]